MNGEQQPNKMLAVMKKAIVGAVEKKMEGSNQNVSGTA